MTEVIHVFILQSFMLDALAHRHDQSSLCFAAPSLVSPYVHPSGWTLRILPAAFYAGVPTTLTCWRRRTAAEIQELQCELRQVQDWRLLTLPYDRGNN
jgi:hypothetical protein